MKIKILDRATLGADAPIDILSGLGELEVFDGTTPEELTERIADADVIILNKVRIDAAALSCATRLRLICVTATGYDNIDINAAKEHSVGVTNVPGYSTDSVTLFTMATTLALVAHLREYNEYVRSGEYTASGVANRLSPVYHEVRGLTWGVIGYGNIGRAVATVAKAMGAHVIANKRTPTQDVECVDIDTLCRRSDIITVHCPLSKDTHHLIDARRLGMMKPGAILVNEARGAVVDSEAVCSAIENGTIGAYGADVYECEPFGKNHPFNRIMDRSNVLLTPHAAWGAYESRKRCVEIVASNIKAFFEDKIQNRVDIPKQ